MNRLVFLNTTILTSTGVFEMYDVTLEEAKKIVNENFVDRLSAIGHSATADVMTELLGIEIQVNRIQYLQKESDIVLCFKLKGRIEEGKILSREDIEKIGYDFKVIKNIQYHTPSSNYPCRNGLLIG